MQSLRKKHKYLKGILKSQQPTWQADSPPDSFLAFKSQCVCTNDLPTTDMC